MGTSNNIPVANPQATPQPMGQPAPAPAPQQAQTSISQNPPPTPTMPGGNCAFMTTPDQYSDLEGIREIDVTIYDDYPVYLMENRDMQSIENNFRPELPSQPTYPDSTPVGA